ncbi:MULTISPECIES: hypothetical protein [unclassified Streptomyces]|uniref:hypothetical protein n=1 Tax=unclassified Streptomyces TaxID=2593676 RepID=UPI0023661078|nr:MULTISPECIES: hypothetical protein [unclassified Streptomyces]MDF3144199.1 hypothetical protein [Streptomyces sp. T21Q-yed]WDF43652.1 hypothetical protein PBV52_46185 [Streptomyces sp. T12]
MSTSGGREHWELLPGAGLGPLRFGMSPAEVAEALRGSEPQKRVGGPYEQEDFADGVKVFYDAGKLACIALDAVTGPQVLLAGFALAGRDPKQAHQFLLDYAAEHGSCLLYTLDDSLALTDLGVLLRSQEVGGVLMSRPVFVREDWLESEYYRDRLPLEGVPATDESSWPS